MFQKKTYFILLITAFSIFGLSTVALYASLLEQTFGYSLSIDLSDQEEEKNPTEEVKEFFEHRDIQYPLKVKEDETRFAKSNWFEHSARLPINFEEVTTPPPEV